MSVLVLAELENAQLSTATLNTISAANQLKMVTHVLVAGSGIETVVDQVAELSGVKQVLYCDNPCFDKPLAEDLVALILTLASGYSHIMAAATTFGKNCMPRLAAIIDVAPITDVIAIEDQSTFKRPIYAGNAIATVRSMDKVKVLTIRSTTFEAVAQQNEKAPIKVVDYSAQNNRSRLIRIEGSRSERPPLSSAKIIISGGRGLQNAEQFKIIERLADRLKAAVGASRAAVDAGFVPNDYQVGQTGKVVAPDLYIAIGISGAIQHLAGIKDSKIIVAINKDPDAPIFEVADYGLVADFFTVLPELESVLDKLGY